MKILSVDDSLVMRKIIRSAVEVLGFDFYEAENGKIALEILEENPDIALILLDWNMPVMDGITTLMHLKEDPRFSGIPVMMVTTESERSSVIKAIQAGAKHYVTKPFSQEDLMTRMMECLGLGVC